MCAVVAVLLRRFSRALSACGMRSILPPLHDLRGGIRHVASLKHCRVVFAHCGFRCAVDSLVGKTAVVKTHGEPGTRESAMRDVRSIAPELLSCRLGIPRGVFRGTTDRNVHTCTHLMQAQVVRKFSGNGDLTFTRETSVCTFGGLRSRDHPSTRRDVPCLIGQERPMGMRTALPLRSPCRCGRSSAVIIAGHRPGVGCVLSPRVRVMCVRGNRDIATGGRPRPDAVFVPIGRFSQRNL